MEHVQIDLAGPFKSSSSGNTYALLQTCVFSGYTVIRAIPDKTSDAVSWALSCIWCDYGAPKIVQSDNGSEFKNGLLKEVVSSIKAEFRYSSAYNPRANGKVESKVGNYKLILFKLVEKYTKTVPGSKSTAPPFWDLLTP